MRYGSVCSGIEAASQAWEPLGWSPQFFSEIEAFPSAVLKHHYPDVPNLGDMTKFQEWPDVAIDLLVGGTPCQSFSIASLRAGLADPRGNLLLTYLAIAARYRPRWLVWENVPGVLSSTSHDAPDPCPPPDPVDMGLDGQEVDVSDQYDSIETNAFGTLLAGLSELGYGFAYRVLDAQFCRAHGLEYAVPQRRRRVFVVGCLGSWSGPAAVLFDGVSLRGDSPPRRETGKRVAPTVEASSGSSRGAGTPIGIVTEVSLTLLSTGPGRHAADLETYVPEIVPQAMSSKWAKGSSVPAGDEVANLVAHALRGEGYDASEDGTGRGTPLVPVAYSITPSNSNKDYNARVADKAQALTTDGGAPSSRGGDIVAVPIAFGSKDHGADAEEQVAPTLRAGGGSSRSYVAQEWAVRRLTPVECCRLQGFPDDYLSQVRVKGKPPADGPMYKALGNSMAVNVMRVIGERIALVDALL